MTNLILTYNNHLEVNKFYNRTAKDFYYVAKRIKDIDLFYFERANSMEIYINKDHEYIIYKNCCFDDSTEETVLIKSLDRKMFNDYINTLANFSNLDIYDYTTSENCKIHKANIN